MKISLIQNKLVALIMVVIMISLSSVFVFSVSATEEWTKTLTFEENETSEITYTYTPSSTAAADGRVGTADIADDGSGNKALKVVSKLTSAEGGNNTTDGKKSDLLTLSLPGFAQKSGLVEISWDLKSDSENYRPFYRLGALQSNGSNSNWRTYSNYISRTGKTTKAFALAENDYTHFRYVIDMDKTENNFYAFIPGGESPYFTATYSVPATDKITMDIRTYYQSGSSWVAPSIGDEGIYWLDNVTVKSLKRESLQIASTSVPNNARNISVVNPIKVCFNSDINWASVTPENNIVVKKNGQVVTDYSLSQPDGASILITPTTEWAEKSDYTIIISRQIAPASEWNEGNPIGGLNADYELEFKTRAADVIAYDDFENYDVNTNLTLGIQDWTNEVTTASGDEWKIVDDGTGNKVLQFTRAAANLKSTAKSKIVLPFSVGKVSEGVVVAEYDVRLVNNRGNLRNLGSIASAYLLYNNSADHLFQQVGNGAGGNANGWNPKFESINDGKIHVKAIIDMDNHEGDYYFNGVVEPLQKPNRKTSDPIESMVFEFAYNSSAALDIDGTGDGVYWIDNISVKKLSGPEAVIYAADGTNSVNSINGGDTVIVGVGAVANEQYLSFAALKEIASGQLVAVTALTEEDFSKGYKSVQLKAPQDVGKCIAEVYFWDKDYKPLCDKITLGN